MTRSSMTLTGRVQLDGEALAAPPRPPQRTPSSKPSAVHDPAAERARAIQRAADARRAREASFLASVQWQVSEAEEQRRQAAFVGAIMDRVNGHNSAPC